MSADADVIIIGAGIAGLSAHHELTQNGIKTIILEKSRGQGGRCATRRAENFIADHGAQFFKMKNPHWTAVIQNHLANLKSIRLNAHSAHPRYIHPSGISSITRFFDAKDSLKTLEKVISIDHSATKKLYELKTESQNQYTARNVILTAPIPQSLELLDASHFKIQDSEIESKLRAVQYDPCIALILELTTEVELGNFGILKNPNNDFVGIYHQGEKGLCTATPTLVAHASPELSLLLWDEDPAHAKTILISKIKDYFLKKGIHLSISQTHFHRWKYSEPKACFEKDYVFLKSPHQELALAGDGFGKSSIEGAFESGLAAAQALLQQGI